MRTTTCTSSTSTASAYGPPAPDDMDFGLEMIDETEVPLSKLIPKSGRKSRWIYEYDFGDGWRHEVLFEGFPPWTRRRSIRSASRGTGLPTRGLRRAVGLR